MKNFIVCVSAVLIVAAIALGLAGDRFNKRAVRFLYDNGANIPAPPATVYKATR
jgi:hypothetical protein